MDEAVKLDQFLTMTKELAQVQATQQMTLDEIRSLKSTLSSQYMPRLEIEEKFRSQGQEIKELKENKKHSVAIAVASIGAIATLGMLLFTMFHH